MTNTTLFKNMIDRYNDLAFTHNYIFGFTFMGNVYVSFQTSDVLPYVCTLDKASRGAGYSLRFKPTKAQKALLCTKAEVVCSIEYFNEVVSNSKYNKGEIFEKMVTEIIFGQKWNKDNVPFTEGGDVEENGVAYQVKFEKATFTNEKTLARLSA